MPYCLKNLRPSIFLFLIKFQIILSSLVEFLRRCLLNSFDLSLLKIFIKELPPSPSLLKREGYVLIFLIC